MATRFTWPTAFGPMNYDELPQALTDIARDHAHRALVNIGSTAPLDLIDQAISTGAAAELLLKATLSSINFHLLRGERADAATTMTLAGTPVPPPAHGSKSSASAGAVAPTVSLPKLKTVGAFDALRVLKLVAPEAIKVTDKQMASAVDVRDAAVHMGFVTQEDNERAIADLVRLIRDLLKIRVELGQDGDWEAFWTPEHVDRADDILRRKDAEIATAYERKLSAARRRFTARWDQIDNADRIRLLEQLEPFGILESNEGTQAHTCPACRCKGRILYRTVRGPVEVDATDFHTPAYFVQITAVPVAFHCNVCDLTLDDTDEFVLAGIGASFDLYEDEASENEVNDWFIRRGDTDYGDDYEGE